MNETVISLDTNIIVVGLQLANSPEERLLDNIYRFQIKLAQQVEHAPTATFIKILTFNNTPSNRILQA